MKTYKIVGGESRPGLKVSERNSSVKVMDKTGQFLIYNFQRHECGAIIKWKNLSISRWLHEYLDERYGVVQESLTVGGHELTCKCDKPAIKQYRFWSDGPSRHHHIKCLNCGNAGAAHTNHHNTLTASGPWVTDED